MWSVGHCFSLGVKECCAECSFCDDLSCFVCINIHVLPANLQNPDMVAASWSHTARLVCMEGTVNRQDLSAQIFVKVPDDPGFLQVVR